MKYSNAVNGILLVGWLLIPSTLFAAGNFIPGNGTRSIGKAGAVVATGDDSEAVYHNPANLGRLRGFGIRLDGTVTFQQLEFTRKPEGSLTFDKVSKDTTPGFIPMVAAWYSFNKLGPGTLTLGAMWYGPHGSSAYKYQSKTEEGACKKAKVGDAIVCKPMPTGGPQRLNRIEATNPMMYLGLAAAYEWRFREGYALRFGGAFKFTYLVVTQRQAAIAAGIFYKAASAKLTDGEIIMNLAADGYSFTGDLGFSITTPVGLSLGFSVLLPVTLNLNGTLNVQLNETFDALAKIRGNQVQFTKTFPAVMRAGLGWSNKILTFEVAFVAELWSVEKALTLRPVNIEQEVLNKKLKLPSFSLPTQLRNSYSLRVGMEYNIREWVLLRLGWLMETGATKTELLSTSTMDYPKHAITGGVSVNLPGGLTIDFSIIHFFPGEFDITNSPSRPVDVSPKDLQSPTSIASVTNGKYRYAITAISFALKGNWMK